MPWLPRMRSARCRFTQPLFFELLTRKATCGTSAERMKSHARRSQRISLLNAMSGSTLAARKANTPTNQSRTTKSTPPTNSNKSNNLEATEEQTTLGRRNSTSRFHSSAKVQRPYRFVERSAPAPISNSSNTRLCGRQLHLVGESEHMDSLRG